jgi:iron complex transport system ATP-binding protein
LSFGFTVLEVALLGRMPHGRANDPEIARRALVTVGLGGFEARGYLSLSGGERQRVHLARVLAQIWEDGEDRVLLLDEPTAALDLVHQHGTLALAKKMSRRGVAVIAVLHDLNLAARYADRIALLSRGALVANGTPREVLQPMVLEPVFGLPVDVLELSDPKQWIVLAREANEQRS